MNDHGAKDETKDAPEDAGAGPTETRDTRGEERRELCVMRAGGRVFAVFAEEVEAVGQDLRPAPLPFAPPTVLGVVALRGRARTLIDPSALPLGDGESGGARADESQSPREAGDALSFAVVALKGDEQLALAAASVEPSVEVAASDIEASAPGQSFARGLVRAGDVTATLLDPSAIFEAAMRGTERRRKR
ncbi:MAG TPA: chemotaxis protein CheW [Pyrinomonadaceae bacterium]|nr:chemotaxis protein CheW [Pyrinomonadaceae bacterium]